MIQLETTIQQKRHNCKKNGIMYGGTVTIHNRHECNTLLTSVAFVPVILFIGSDRKYFRAETKNFNFLSLKCQLFRKSAMSEKWISVTVQPSHS